ncbi:hypothetical protein J6590_072669 [Homalodisca vitripennis]|nr:hypothetical protein J6590_072669 [Homalodisca vitripennis]
MSFKIEETKRGKPCILYNEYKFRQHRILKNGDVSWICLGKNCGASLKTDSSYKTMTVGNAKHSGPHPVTMRRLSMPQRSPSAGAPCSLPLVAAPTVTPSLPSQTCSTTPTVTHVLSTSTSTPAAPTSTVAPDMSTPVVSLSPHYSILDTSSTSTLQPELPTIENLVKENSILQEKIAELKEQLRHVIDHTIENDKRLLQYTDEIFVVNSPQSVMTTRASVADFGTQCDLPAICMEEQCVNSRTDINNLRTTVEVLEAELRTLRGTRCGKCGGEDGGSEWTVQRGKGRPLQINNRFAALKTDIQESGNKNKNYKGPKLERRPNTAPRKKAQQPVFKTKASLPFHTVWINGDSHGRNIAELVQSMVTRDTTVEGACRPGAKLQTVNSDATPPPGSCYVLIAGTNDLAAGQQYNIYRHLELCITAKLKTAKVIVLTLPHRHDLPTDHPINKETKLVNAYIEELCARHSGAVVLDFNLIRRGAFTRHGMHLKTKSKQLLARHLIQCMQELGHIPGAAQSSPPTDTRRQSSAGRKSSSAGVTEPRTLPYETFADAVKTTKNSVKKTKNFPPLMTTTVT